MDYEVSKRGRKMRPGRYVAGPPRIFVSYCDNCHHKVLLPVQDMRYFGMYFRKQNRSLRARLIKWLSADEVHKL